MAEQVRIRDAVAEDAPLILRLIRDLAEYESMLDQVKITEADIRRDGFGAHPRFACIIAELETGGAWEAVGYALWYHNYSTFEGRAGIYVEDLYVSPHARGRQLGRALLAHLARKVRDAGGVRLDLSVLDWNPTRRFYEHLGFRGLSEWLPYRLTGDALPALADEAP